MLTNDKIEKIIKVMDIILAVTGFFVLVSLVFVVGFYLSSWWVAFFAYITDVAILIFIVHEIIRFLLAPSAKFHIQERWIEMIIVGLAFIQILFPETVKDIFEFFVPGVNPAKITLLYLGILEISLLFILTVKLLRINDVISRIKLHPGAIISLSFLLVILTGSLLLMLPRATSPESPISYIDALFTSTSAVCVTGLNVIDPATKFTTFGKLVVLMLIQVGGLGVMTLTTFFAFFLAGGLSVKARLVMKDMLSEDSLAEVKKLLYKILLYTLVIETIGALFLYIFTARHNLLFDSDLFYLSVFHSVSAFCNAGFALYTENLMHPDVMNNYGYLTTIMLLIVFGGLGFVVHANLIDYLRNKKKNKIIMLKIHTKIVLISTAFLIFVGGLIIFLFEPYAFAKNFSLFDKFFHSIFLSVTSRTAGFNTVPSELITPATTMVVILLMWIGASPGSTGGGIKTTTLSVVFITLYNFIIGKERVEIFKREINPDGIKLAFLVIVSSLLILGLGSTLMVWLEPDKDPLSLIFEATSAISTVGLSRAVSPFLGEGGKIVIISLMYIGRIGVLTFLLSLYKPKPEPKYKFPTENIVVG